MQVLLDVRMIGHLFLWSGALSELGFCLPYISTFVLGSAPCWARGEWNSDWTIHYIFNTHWANNDSFQLSDKSAYLTVDLITYVSIATLIVRNNIVDPFQVMDLTLVSTKSSEECHNTSTKWEFPSTRFGKCINAWFWVRHYNGPVLRLYDEWAEMGNSSCDWQCFDFAWDPVYLLLVELCTVEPSK